MTQNPQSALDSQTVAKQRQIVSAAAAHCDLLRAYFAFQAYGGLLAGVLLLLSPIIGHTVTVEAKPWLLARPWLVLPLAAVNTWAAFRSRRLLGHGDREGVWMAAGIFGSDLLAAIATGHPGFGAIFSGVGLVLTRSVWRGMQASATLILTPRPNER